MARVEYDEFGLLRENAAEFGIPFDRPPTVARVDVPLKGDRHISALRWGEGSPEVVLLHGGGQNAHTWDTVALAIGRPLLAVDLPGHGHSGPVANSDRLSPEDNAEDVSQAIRQLAPVAEAVVGMSLGGLTTIALADAHPELVRRVVLVDITPGVTSEKSRAISAFVNGPRTFPSFDDILARTVAHNPTRTEASLRRGILHNAMQLDDGTWMWRYRRFETGATVGSATGPLDFGRLWAALGRTTVPLLLVRGMQPQSVVDDADVAALLQRRPDASIAEVAEAGHSVQGDSPLELAGLIARFIDGHGLALGQ